MTLVVEAVLHFYKVVIVQKLDVRDPLVEVGPCMNTRGKLNHITGG